MNHVSQRGFTLIELMLSMTFIAVLLMAIAFTTVQISQIYTKGITLTEVNQEGRSLTGELQRNISSSIPFDVTPRVDDSPSTAFSKYVVRDGGGRLCLGGYSYIWNYGKALAGGIGAPAIFNIYDDGTPVRFAKVADSGGALCATSTTPIPHAQATEMLSSGDRDLVVHAFNITRTSNDPTTNQSIYALSITIGTNDTAQLTSDDASCKPPSANVGDESYCSVNEFDIIARAGNNAGGDQ